jgi:hypothetical protein
MNTLAYAHPSLRRPRRLSLSLWAVALAGALLMVTGVELSQAAHDKVYKNLHAPLAVASIPPPGMPPPTKQYYGIPLSKFDRVRLLDQACRYSLFALTRVLAERYPAHWDYAVHEDVKITGYQQTPDGWHTFATNLRSIRVRDNTAELVVDGQATTRVELTVVSREVYSFGASYWTFFTKDGSLSASVALDEPWWIRLKWCLVWALALVTVWGFLLALLSMLSLWRLGRFFRVLRVFTPCCAAFCLLTIVPVWLLERHENVQRLVVFSTAAPIGPSSLLLTASVFVMVGAVITWRSRPVKTYLADTLLDRPIP